MGREREQHGTMRGGGRERRRVEAFTDIKTDRGEGDGMKTHTTETRLSHMWK